MTDFMKAEQFPIFPPINLLAWVERHREFLKPPVCNKLVFEENGFFIMVVGGPNQRKDFHVDEGPEFFYQIEGDMLLKTVQEGKIIGVFQHSCRVKRLLSDDQLIARTLCG